MADDVLKYMTGTDPYAANPFAEGEAIKTGETPFAEELPFRFTQFAINPSAKATSGQTGRAAVARSPYTSGALASELRDIRNQISGMGNVQAPGTAPVAPVVPEISQTEEKTISLGRDPVEDTGNGISSGMTGLPTREYQLPSNIMLEGMNPIYAAQQFEKYKDKLSPEELASLGPMQSISGYDMKATLGEEEYGNWFGDKTFQGDKNRATQTMYKNLSMLPSTVDPGFGKTKNELNLATKDFSYNPYTNMSREEINAPQIDPRISTGGADSGSQFTSSPESDGIVRLGESGLYFDPTGANPGTAGNTDMEQFTANLTKDLSAEQHNKNALTRGINAVLPSVIIAGMSYGLGSGVAGLAAAGVGVGTGAASGAAGAMGMSAGLGASAVNAGVGIAGSVAATKIAEQLGVNVNSPLVQMLMAAAAGGTAGYMSGGNVAGNDLYKTAESFGMSDSEFAAQILSGENGQFNSIAEYIEKQPQMLNSAIENGEILSNTTNLGTAQVSPGAFRMGAPGFDQLPDSNPANPVVNDLSKYGLKTGLGVAESAVVDANAGASSPEMMQYNSDYSEYEQMMREYEDKVAAYEKLQALQGDYETKMGEFTKTSGDWKTYTGLRSRQQGLSSQIAGNISENPFYDAPENYRGIQSEFI